MEFDDPTVRRQLGGFALAAVALAGVTLLVSPETALNRLRTVAEDPLLFGVAVAALYLLRPLAAWPVTPLAVVVGYGYGVALGIPVALAGAVATCAVPFFVARHFRGEAGLVGRLGDSGGAFFEATGGARGVAVARLIPVPSDVVSCAAGVSGVPFRALAVGTAVGELPWTVVAVLAGSSMDRLSTAGATAVDARLVAVALLAALLLLAGPVYRRLSA